MFTGVELRHSVMRSGTQECHFHHSALVCVSHACHVIMTTSDGTSVFQASVKEKGGTGHALTFLLEREKISQEAPVHLFEHLRVG